MQCPGSPALTLGVFHGIIESSHSLGRGWARPEAGSADLINPTPWGPVARSDVEGVSAGGRGYGGGARSGETGGPSCLRRKVPTVDFWIQRPPTARTVSAKTTLGPGVRLTHTPTLGEFEGILRRRSPPGRVKGEKPILMLAGAMPWWSGERVDGGRERGTGATTTTRPPQ